MRGSTTQSLVGGASVVVVTGVGVVVVVELDGETSVVSGAGLVVLVARMAAPPLPVQAAHATTSETSTVVLTSIRRQHIGHAAVVVPFVV
ncbi:MAG: hypothetical protein R2823_03830 [Acidimicrobiia bacterium]